MIGIDVDADLVPDGDPLNDPEQAAGWTALLELLSDDEAQVVDLRFRVGLRVREVAEELGISERTIERRLKSAYAKVREWLSS